MPYWVVVWLAILTVALVAHIMKDNSEFQRIRRLEDEVQALKKK